MYLSKLLLPEMEQPETLGRVTIEPERPHRNAIDAAAGGATDGLYLALNVAAMLIAFIAFIALVNFMLINLPTGQHLWDWLWQLNVDPNNRSGWRTVQRFALTMLGYVGTALVLRKVIAGLATWLGLQGLLDDYRRGSRWLRLGVLAGGYLLFLGVLDLCFYNLVEELTLKDVFATLFAPVAFFMGVEAADVSKVADLLGIKLALNEFVAFASLVENYGNQLSQRSFLLSTFALTGFANFASIGIQLGGIGAMAPHRRGDLARLGGRALFVGFLATVMNAAIAGMLLEVANE